MYKIKTLRVFLFVFSIGLPAQESATQKDAAIWINEYFEMKVNKRIAVHLNQQNRLVNNISQFGLWYADIGVTYKFNKNFKVLADYVFAQKRKDEYWSSRHQFYIALYARKKLYRWSFSNRNMIQNAYADILSSETGKLPKLYYRNKTTIKREIDKYVSFYVAQEFYLPLNDYRQKYFDRSRTFLGVFYNLSRHDELELYVLFQNELNPIKRKEQDYVLGLGYSKSF